jgi:hypothetical protein
MCHHESDYASEVLDRLGSLSRFESFGTDSIPVQFALTECIECTVFGYYEFECSLIGLMAEL